MSARAARRPRATSTLARRSAIADLVRSRRVATQGELQRLLRARGIAVTQATLSRDLAQLGARRAPRAGGGTAYEVDGPPAAAGAGLGAMAELVVDIRDAAALVVVQTRPGAAQAIAAALDQARLPAVAGTLAGDDTIFVAPARGASPRRLAAELARRFGATGRGPLA